MGFILSIQVGIGILQVPKGVSEHAGHDSWLTYLFAGILVLAAELLMLVLLKRFQGVSIFDINRKLFGRYIGFIFNLVLIIYLLLATIINLRYYVMIVASWFFRTTPLWVLTLLLISPCIYAAYKGLKAICRISAIVYFTIFMSISILCYSFIYFRPTQLMPVGSRGIYPILQGISGTSFSFFGFETLLFIYPFIKDRQNIAKSMVGASIISTLLFIFVTVVCFGVFGENMLKLRNLPFAGLSRLVKFPILERMDLYFLAIWIPGMTICNNAYLFLTYNSIKKVFNVKSGMLLFLVICAVIILLSSFTQDMDILTKATAYIGYATYTIGFTIPVLWLLLSLIFRKGGKQSI